MGAHQWPTAGWVTDTGAWITWSALPIVGFQRAAGGLAYIIAAGRAEITRDGKTLAMLGPGDVVGELSLLDGEPRSATVRARTDLSVLEIDSRDLERLLKRVPTLARKLLVSMAGRLRDTDAMGAPG